MKRTTMIALTALLFPFLFSSCQKDGPVERFAFTVEVTRVSANDPSNSPWDVGGPPDVYAVFKRKNFTAEQRTSTAFDKTTPYLLNGALSDEPNDYVYQIFFYDDDSDNPFGGGDDYIGGYEFTVDVRGRPAVKTLDDSFERIAAKLYFTYE
jgi:hypothetical protein